MTVEMSYAGLSSADVAEIERRRERVDHAYSANVVLCDICGVTFRDYHSAMASADWGDAAVVAFSSRPPYNPPTLQCRHRNAATECPAKDQMRRRFDDPIPFPSSRA